LLEVADVGLCRDGLPTGGLDGGHDPGGGFRAAVVVDHDASAAPRQFQRNGLPDAT